MLELADLVELVKEGDDEGAVEVTREVLHKIEPKKIIEALTDGMREMGEQFEEKVIFLPELLIASEALLAVMAIVEPLLELDAKETEKKTVVIGTVAGDIHEIGKNIVCMVLKANSYNVVDLGKDVPAEKFISKAEESNAYAIGLSTLMTTTMQEQKKVIDLLVKDNKREKYKVLIGGAPVSQRWADEIGADFYCKDAFEAVKLLSLG